MTKKTIYVLDDEPDILDLFAMSFPEHDVSCFTNLDEARKACFKIVPDLLITDLVVKDDDGIDLITDLNKRLPNIAIFVMSGFLTKDRLNRLEKLKTIDISSKPFNMMSYGQKIKNYIQFSLSGIK